MPRNRAPTGPPPSTPRSLHCAGVGCPTEWTYARVLLPWCEFGYSSAVRHSRPSNPGFVKASPARGRRNLDLPAPGSHLLAAWPGLLDSGREGLLGLRLEDLVHLRFHSGQNFLDVLVLYVHLLPEGCEGVVQQPPGDRLLVE